MFWTCDCSVNETFVFTQMSCQIWDSRHLSQEEYQYKLPKMLPKLGFKFAGGGGEKKKKVRVMHSVHHRHNTKLTNRSKMAHCEACDTEQQRNAGLCLLCLVQMPHLCAQNANSNTSNPCFPISHRDTMSLTVSQCGKTSITRNVKCYTSGFIHATFLFICQNDDF